MTGSPAVPTPEGASPDDPQRALLPWLYVLARQARPPAAARQAALVSTFTLGAQMFALVAQVAFAVVFGASSRSDAFFAALALPLYVTTILVGSVSVVFVPILAEHRARAGAQGSTEVAAGALQLVSLSLSAVAVAGIAFAEPLIAWTVPGLDPEARALATELAVLLWPSVIGSALVALLSALWQIEGRFGWAAAVPLVGAGVNLGVLVALTPGIGVVGAAVAWTASSAVQVVLLAPILRRYWRAGLALSHPGVIALVSGLAPLALANVFIRASTLLERYLGSQLEPGELSQVSYASRIVAAVGIFVAAGPGAVLFVRLANDAAAGDRSRVAGTVSRGIRAIWLVVAPLVALMIALAEPAVRLALEHGAFSRADSLAVAALVRVYSLSVVAVALSAVTAHAIYALRATRLVAAVGAVEGIAYVIYTSLLAQRYGATGIALGFSIYYLGSVTWQLVYLRHATHAGGGGTARSFLVTTAIAGACGLAAWVAGNGVEAPLPALVAGVAAGIALYAVGIVFLQRTVLRLVIRAV